MNWLQYLGEANLYLAVFYLAYRLLLSKETHNQLNRFYLLFSCIAAFTLPVLQLGILKPAQAIVINQTYPTDMFYPQLGEQMTTNQAVALPVTRVHHLNWQDCLIYAYALGCAVLLLALLIKLFVLVRMIWNAKRERRDQYRLIYLPESDIAFSFFNYLFIGTNAAGEKTIIRHELVHIRQKHSLDIMFVEVLKIFNWFNPFVYLLQNSLKTIHEYIADEQTAAYENDTVGYTTFLVNNAYGAGSTSITHSFFNYNLLKKRIIMLNRKRSGTSARLKYLIAAPVFAGLLCASTLAFSKDYGWIDLDPAYAPTRLEVLPPVTPSARQMQTNKLNHKYPPPTILSDGYKKLNQHLITHVRYDKTIPSWTKGSVVIVSFNVTNDHKITGARIFKSGGQAFDSMVLHAFETYGGDVADYAGEHKFVFNFYGYNGVDNEKDLNLGRYDVAGLLVIVPPVVKFPPPTITPHILIVVNDEEVQLPADAIVIADTITDVPANTAWAIKKWGTQAKYGVKVFSGHTKMVRNAYKNVDFDEHGGGKGTRNLRGSTIPYDPATLFIVNGKKQIFDAGQIKANSLVSVSCDSMVIYEKGNDYAHSKWGNDAGKTVVLMGENASADLVNFAAKKAASDTLALVFNELYQYLQAHIRYPAIAHDNNITGKVFAVMDISKNGKLRYLTIVRSPSNSISEEVFNALKNCPTIKKMPEGTWTLPLNFSLGYIDNGSTNNIPAATPPPAETEQKSFKFFDAAEPSTRGKSLKMLDELVIRSYIARTKN